MSLIADALRKARQDAARREAEARGEAAPPIAPDRGRAGRIGAVLLAGGAIGLAAAIAGGGVVWWALGRGASPDPAASRAEPVASAAVPPAPTATPEEPRRPSPAPEPHREVPPLAASPARQTATEPAPPRPGWSPPDAATEVPAVPTPTPPAPAPTATAAAGERVFVLEADLGYVRLSLGYVVDRPGDPFAEVNGQEVHVGSTVDGFVVEAITRSEVRLRDDRGPVVLRVR